MTIEYLQLALAGFFGGLGSGLANYLVLKRLEKLENGRMKKLKNEMLRKLRQVTNAQ